MTGTRSSTSGLQGGSIGTQPVEPVEPLTCKNRIVNVEPGLPHSLLRHARAIQRLVRDDFADRGDEAAVTRRSGSRPTPTRSSRAGIRRRVPGKQ